MNHEKVLSMLVESVKIWQILQIIANIETVDTHQNIHITETRTQTQTTLGEIKSRDGRPAPPREKRAAPPRPAPQKSKSCPAPRKLAKPGGRGGAKFI